MLGDDKATADEEMEMDTENWDEDSGEQLSLADVEAGMKRVELCVREEVVRVDAPNDARM